MNTITSARTASLREFEVENHLGGSYMKNFRDLLVWQKAHALTLQCYKATAQFPKEERYGLTSQIRRCSASIAANLAEGCGRRGAGEFHRFLQISAGSASELEYHCLLASDLGFLNAEDHKLLDTCVIEVKRMLSGLIRKVESERHNPSTLN